MWSCGTSESFALLRRALRRSSGEAEEKVVVVGDHLDRELAGADDRRVAVALRGIDQPHRLAEVVEPVALAAVQHDALDVLALLVDRGGAGHAATAQRGERG